MTQIQCEFEQQVVVAIRSGKWSEQLRQHISACDHCQEVQQIAMSLMSLDIRVEEILPPVPDPNLLWLMVELQAHRRTQVYRNLVAGGAAAAVFAAVWGAYALWFNTSAAGTADRVPSPISGTPFPLDATFLFILIAVALVFLLPLASGPQTQRKSRSRLMTL